MGRLFSIVGLLCIIASVAAPVLISTNGFQFNFDFSPDTASLCAAGETLVEEKGASEYTPGQGYASPVRYFCQDAEGRLREVTGDFAEGLVSGVSGIFGDVGGLINQYLIWAGVFVVGLVLLIFGGIMGRGRRRTAISMPIIMSSTSTSGSPLEHWAQPNAPTVSSADAFSLAARLKQLEAARAGKLIDEGEYERLRQRLLDEFSGG